MQRAAAEALRPCFADVQDHAQHVMAELDTYRDLLGAALDVHVFYAFNRLGLILKRLAAVTVIIMAQFRGRHLRDELLARVSARRFGPSAGSW